MFIVVLAGCGQKERKNHPLHSPEFCPDENMIIPTVELLTDFVKRYLGAERK